MNIVLKNGTGEIEEKKSRFIRTIRVLAEAVRSTNSAAVERPRM